MLKKHSAAEFIKFRKQIVDKEFSFLNPMQKKAVLTTEGPLLLLAGAGSGKTTVLINRIANLIRFGCAYTSDYVADYIYDEDFDLLEEYINNPNPELRDSVDRICAVSPAAPWSIIAITFTNKAAKELKERLERTIGAMANDVWAATFHSACVRILHRDIERLGFQKSFTIYDTADSERILKEIISELRLDEKVFPPKAILNIMGKVKDKMMSPSDFEKECGQDYRLGKIAKIYGKYQKRLKDANALDFDDIILHTVTLLKENQDIREYYQKKFRYVLIDEYQDTNHAQYMLASLLAGGYNNICVVGDDDQSIYRFRGATIDNILQFEEKFEYTKTIRLEQNYRSTSPILNVANSVICNNCGRKSKKLWTENKGGELPYLYCAQNEHDEAAYIANEMLAAYAKGRRWRDFAILYRINAQSMQFENAFKRNGIPYRLIGGTRFFDRAEIKDMLAYLWVLRNPSDTLRLKRIINVPARKIGAKTIETVEEIAGERSETFFEVMRNAQSLPQLRSAAALFEFADMIDTLRKSVDTIPLSVLYDNLLDKTGYARALELKGDEESKTRLENVMELKSNILDYEKNSEENGTLGGFLDEVSLFTDIERYDNEADAVVMMTIHSAKGLEFPTVFLCGAEEGLFPGFRSIGIDDEIEEERRLFYVAVTRAKESLYLTYATSRMLFGQTKFSKASRFIEEIPTDMVQTIHRTDPFGHNIEKSHKPSAKKTAKNNFVSFTAQAPKAAVAPNPFHAGDRAEHKSFGEGMVISAAPVGGDTLLEIAFDRVGTKRLLYKTASQYLSKL